ncbi:MAG: hypothetical protein HY904_05140 [Deltaproteobacteria bacterium]|nr:hypothetical protein [Deltaproteobacteria bacterium]
MRKPWLLIALLCAACGWLPPLGPQPKYDDNTGLTGVPTGEGSLAGTWAFVIEFATIVRLPILGDRNGGSQSIRILHRTWDADRKVYTDLFKWCHHEVFEVEGTRSVITDETVRKIHETGGEVTVDHARGDYQTGTIVVTWGVQNLPDPEHTELPTKDNYTSPPQSDWMLDEDGDSHPGVTVNLEGALGGYAYVVSRNIHTMDGTVISPDRIQGLTRSSSNQQHTVEAQNHLARGESRVRPDPDPKESWFDMVRMPDGATCDDVMAAANDGRVSTRRPF